MLRMESNRKELLASSAEETNDNFIAIIKRHDLAKGTSNSLNDVLAVFSRQQLEELWSNLQEKCSNTLLTFGSNDMEENEENQAKELDKNRVALLQSVLTVAMTTLSLEDTEVPSQVFTIAVLLHGVLLVLPDEMDKLKINIAKFCELWWKKDLEGKEELAPQTFMFLLEKSVDPKATGADIKRVWQAKDMLLHLDLNSENGEALTNLLLHACVSSKYLQSEQGTKFVSFLFTLSPELIEKIHATIKEHIPTSSMSSAESYGNIYFRAWKNATGTCLEKIEQTCIQDLMFYAVHVKKSPGGTMKSLLKKILHQFHRQKLMKGVDEMLHRLYEPILWRALKVPNGQVRANALGLMIDAFPIINPDLKEEVDQELQKQFDLLEELLLDPNHVVRATAVQGVCQICNVYWELIPAATIAALLSKIARKLAWDKSTDIIRVVVVKGFMQVLDNALSHPLLKKLLPQIGNMLHDYSESVRIQFVQLLLKVKGIPGIKFWEIVPLEQLFDRLVEDSTSVARNLVDLIYNSFMPKDETGNELVARCVGLVNMNCAAARRFYQYAHDLMSLQEACKYMWLLGRTVLTCVQKAEEEEKENESDDALSVKDTEVMAGLLEVIDILWEGIRSRLDKPGREDMKEQLQSKFGKAIPEYFSAFNDDRIRACLTHMAGNLPATMIPVQSCTTLAKLKNLPPGTATGVYGPMLEAMCKWGKFDDVTRLISQSLDTTLDETEMEKNPGVLDPSLALGYLLYVTQHSACRDIVTKQNTEHLRKVSQSLRAVLQCIETRLATRAPLNDSLTDEVLLNVFETYFKIEVILHNPENENQNAVTAVKQMLIWTKLTLLPTVGKKKKKKRLNQTNMTLLGTSDGLEGNDTLFGSTANQTLLGTTVNQTLSQTLNQTSSMSEFTLKLMEVFLNITANMLLVGIGDRELLSQLADFVDLLLQTDNEELLPYTCSLIYQITELYLSWEMEQNEEGTGQQENFVVGMLGKLIKNLQKLLKKKKEQAEKIVLSVKQLVSESVTSYYRSHSVFKTDENESLMPTIVTAVLADVEEAIRNDNSLPPPKSVSELPHLSHLLMGMVTRKKAIIRLFTEEFQQHLTPEGDRELETIASAVYILYPLCKGKTVEPRLQDCLPLAKSTLDGVDVSDLMEESTHRQLFNECQKLLQESLQTVPTNDPQL